MDVYECQKCEQWFAEPLKEIRVHRYDTLRTTNGAQGIIGEWIDKAMVCDECYGGLALGGKVGFVADE